MLKFPSYNDDDIFRSDLAWEYKTEMWGYIGPSIKTDRRKKIIINTDFGLGYGKNRGLGYRTSIGINIRPITQMNINIEMVQDLSPTYMQWVDVLDLYEDTVRVYANSEQKTRDINLRLNWTFSPELTLECFLQPFYVNMNYNRYYNLTDPQTMNLVGYDYLFNNEDPSFLIKNLKVIKLNIVKDKHISVILKPNTGATIRAICFNCLNTKLGHYLLNYKKKINIIAQIQENIWNNKKTIQLIIKDLIL